MVGELYYNMIVLNLTDYKALVFLIFFFFYFFNHKEEDKRRVGRAAKKRERSGTAEAAGEERERGDSWQWEDKRVTYLLTLSDTAVYMLEEGFHSN